MIERPTVLVTGVGSLVGQTILDSLEGRRAGVCLVGCNSTPDSPNNFRCDRAYIVPATSDPDHDAAILRLCARERPALVIPGRDPDVGHLARLAQARPSLRAKLLAGSVRMAEMLADKVETARFSLRHGLPFAETVDTDASDARAAARALVERHGLPLIAKPRNGSGSIGVRVVLHDNHLDAVLSRRGFVVQPFLGPLPDRQFPPPDDAGIPLFWGLEENDLHGVQVLIGPDGCVGPRIGFRSKMVVGRCERLERDDDPTLLAVGEAFACAVAAEGWRGPFNVQAKRDGTGAWRAIELNGRFSGGTSARLHLGFDEVAWVVNAWLGGTVVPVRSSNGTRVVVRQFVDRPVDRDALATLVNESRWSAAA